MSAIAEACADVMAYTRDRGRGVAHVEAVPLADEPGCTAYQITGATQESVQRAIDAIVYAPDTVEAQFRNPARTYSMVDSTKQWRARGYARSGA